MRLLLLLPAIVYAPTLSAQTTVTVTPDADVTIYSELPNTNGTGDRLFHGANSGGNPRRALVHFPIESVVPAGATVTSVEFELWVEFSNSNNQMHCLHRLEADWAEGPTGGSGQGGGAQVGEPTWFWRSYLVDPWITGGGDFVPTASTSLSLANFGRQVFPSTAQMVADVQDFVDAPTSNFGWILIGQEAVLGAAYRSGSREFPLEPPLLRITFDWPSIAAPYGFSCGAFVLDAVGLPALGNGSFAIDIATPIFASGQSILFSTDLISPTPFVLGCALNVDPAGILATLPTDPSGTLPLPLPAGSTNLLGSQLFAQGAGINTSTGNLLLTNGLLLQIGN